MKIMMRIVKFGSVAIFFVVLICCKPNDDPMSQISKTELQKMIDTEIPTGSSKDEVIQFLTQKGIGCTDQSPYFNKTPRGEDLGWVVCSIQQRSLFYENYKLVLEFYFTKDSEKLVRYSLYPNRPV